MLGPVDLFHIPLGMKQYGRAIDGLDVVVVGGESGPGARPMNPDWVRSVRDQCQEAGVAFFFKSWGEWVDFYTHPDAKLEPFTLANKRLCAAPYQYVTPDGKRDGVSRYGSGKMVRVGKKAAGRILDGRTWDEWPGTPRGIVTRRGNDEYT